jgi:hypothetical protein
MTPLVANAGLPMLVVQWPLMAMALVPIVLVEMIVVRRAVVVPFRFALLDVGLANVDSTLAGVPLAWIVMVAIEFAMMIVTDGGTPFHSESPIATLTTLLLQVAWLAPNAPFQWAIPAAATILLIPCLFASVPIERWVLARRWPWVDKAKIRSASLWANVWSYALLLVAGSIWTVVNLR